MAGRRSRSPADAVLLVLVLAIVAGCAGDDGPSTSTVPGSTSTSTTAPPRTTITAAPPTTAPPDDGLALGEARPATATCPATPAWAAPDPDRPRYDMAVEVFPGDGGVSGQLRVRFNPDLPTDRLVFRLWPNGPRPAEAGAILQTGLVTIDGQDGEAPATRPDPTTLVVDLGRTLNSGDTVVARMAWKLTLPDSVDDRVSRTGEAVRLGSFFPILAWEPGVGWAERPATGAFAEASMAPVADFAYSVTVPEGLSVLGSGVEGSPGRWRATAHRDIALSVGRFRTAEATAAAPEPVRVVVGVHDGLEEDPARYLDRVVRSLTDFATRFGAYPYRSLTLALTPELGGGIEYPGHIMQGPGTIGSTTPHEVGHQWFYGLVGNDQGRDPWLDEGLASWAEARFEATVPEFVAAAIPDRAQGRAGEPMTFWETRQGSYYRGVYVQGTQALAALGPADAVDCGLRHYVAGHAFTVATPGDLVSSMRTVFPDAEATLAPFGIAG